MVAEAKSTYESKLVLDYASTNNSKIFKHISSIKKQDDFPSKMSYNDEFAVNDSDKAQLFNKYFYSVFTIPDSISIKEPPHPSSQSLHDIQFTQSDVFALLTSLDINKACGFDNFNPKILRYCASSLLQIICHQAYRPAIYLSIGALTVLFLSSNQVTSLLYATTIQYRYCVFSPN